LSSHPSLQILSLYYYNTEKPPFCQEKRKKIKKKLKKSRISIDKHGLTVYNKACKLIKQGKE